MRITITKPFVFGMRFSPVPGGLGTTETHLSPGTTIVAIGNSHNGWKVVSDHLATFFSGNIRYTASTKGCNFSSLVVPE